MSDTTTTTTATMQALLQARKPRCEECGFELAGDIITMPKKVFEAVDLLADTLVSGTLHAILIGEGNGTEKDDAEFIAAIKKAAAIYEPWACSKGLR
jgi:hypothetical protein